MASTVFRLPLAPPETLGRRFQYALFSLDPKLVEVDEAQGVAVFQSPSDYVKLVSNALAKIQGLTTRQKPRKCKSSIVRGINCCNLHRGPSLYAVGRMQKGQRLVGDHLTLVQAGLTRCPYTSSTGKAPVAWTHAAVSYADVVIDNGGPLGGQAQDLPWLAKATLFGKKLRTAGGGRQYRAQRPTLDTLGSILLGGAVAFAWSQKLGKTVKTMVEFLLVPDSVHEGYARLRDLMLPSNATLEDGVVARAARIADRYPVSVEVALSIVLASELAEKLSSANQVTAYQEALMLEKAATLVTLTRRRRPMIRSVIPLSTAVYAAYKKETLKDALDVAVKTGANTLDKVQGLRNVIGTCIGAMYMQAVNCRWSDHLSACIRNLHAAADSAENEGLPSLAGILRRLANKLSGDYKRMLTGAVRAC